MGTSELLYNRLGWTVVALAFMLAVLHIAAAILLTKRSRQVASPEQHNGLSGRILLLALAGTASMFLIFACFLGPVLIPLLAYQYQHEVLSCVQTPIADGYILVIEDKRNGEREVNLEDSLRTERYIWSITKYQVARTYLLGETSFLPGDRDFFWFDFETQLYFDTRSTMSSTAEDELAFRASLTAQGLAAPSGYLPAVSLCQAGECVPCAETNR